MATRELPTLLNRTTLEYYLNLPTPMKKLEATYVWIDPKYEDKICSKTRTLDLSDIRSVDDVPSWFDSMYDDDDNAIEFYLQPVEIYPNPFSSGKHKLVLCDVYLHDDISNGKTPAPTNKRPICLEASELAKAADPWFGIEQEYTLLGIDRRPLGWPENGFPRPEELFYFTGVGTDRVIGRQISVAHYWACLYAGLNICGTTAETMPAQWEYQIGPISGIEVSDQLIISRYILRRVAEDFQVIVTFDPKPVEGWSGSSCHTNFSTKKMRLEGGMEEIEKNIDKLRKKHEEHLKVYDLKQGEDNKRRLVGKYCAPSMKFMSGIFKTESSVRIPRISLIQGKGYFEDRRPASDCNPYAVVNAILRTCVLNEGF